MKYDWKIPLNTLTVKEEFIQNLSPFANLWMKFVITGNFHLVKLSRYLKMEVLNAAAFLEKL